MRTQFQIKLTFVLCLMLPPTLNASVLYVDNSSVSPGVYKDFTSAINAAQPGDTIYIQPTDVTYVGGFNINKRVHVIGPGHHLSYTTVLPLVQGISIWNTGSGTIIEGLAIQSTITLFTQSNNVVIRNCRFIENASVSMYENVDNLVVEGNVFEGYISAFQIIDMSNFCENTLIKNNYFRINSTNPSVAVVNQAQPTTIFEHNTVFISNEGSYCSQCVAHTINNNLWVGTNKNISSGAEASIFNNNQTWSTTASFDTLPGINLDNIQPVFVDASTFGWSVNKDFNLVPENAGYTGSAGGDQTGMYGGGFNFRKRGEPFGIPTFDQVLLLDRSVSPDGVVRVKVVAKKGLE